MTDNLNLANNVAPLGSNPADISLSTSPAKSPLEEAVAAQENTQAQNPAGPELNIGAPAPSVVEQPEVIPTAPSLDNLQPSITPATSTLTDSPIPAGAPDPMNMPAQAGPTSTQPVSEPVTAAATAEPASLEAPVVPPVESNVPVPPPAEENQDLGEPSEAPDTDEFLQSILDSKSSNSSGAETQPQNDVLPSDALDISQMQDQNNADFKTQAPTDNVPEPTSNTPVAPEQPVESSPILPSTSEIPAEPVSAVADNAINQNPNTIAPFQEVSPAEATSGLTELSPSPVLPEMEASAPNLMATSQLENQPSTEAPETQKSAEIDSLTSATSPLTDSPEHSPVADVFNASKAPSKFPVKLILLIFIVAAVLVAVYFVAKTYFFSTNTANTQTGLGTATPASSAVALTGDAARKSDLMTIQQALLNLYSANGKYPVAASYIQLNQAGNVVEKELVPNYMNKIPTDPTSTKAYQYKSDGSTFTLTAVLDNQSDPGITIENGVALYKVDQSTDITVSAQSTSTASSNSGTFDNADSSNMVGSSSAQGSVDAMSNPNEDVLSSDLF